MAMFAINNPSYFQTNSLHGIDKKVKVFRYKPGVALGVPGG
jgi:hypothetical protein